MTRIHVQYRRRERYDAAYYRGLHIQAQWPERSPYRQSRRRTPMQRCVVQLACALSILGLLVIGRAVRAVLGG